MGYSLATGVLDALGGKANIGNLDACITRLRVSVKKIDVVDKNQLKKLGAAGIMTVGDNLQIIFGPKSDQLKSQIKEIIDGVIDMAAEIPIIELHEHRIYKADKESILKLKEEINYE